MTTTRMLKKLGYVCRRERCGPYMGAFVDAYRVRRPDGALAMYAASTYRTARQAWAEAVGLYGAAERA